MVFSRSAPPPNAPPPIVATSGAPVNTLAIVAICLAAFFPLGGLVVGHLALSQIKRTGEQGRAMAIWALVLGYMTVGFLVLIGLIRLAVVMTQGY